MKRKLFFIIALACCLVLAVGILAACNDSGTSGQQTPGGEDPGTETPGDNPGGEDPGDETVSFIVTFDTQGGSALADITVENGQVIGEFTLPTKQCSRLVGFALDTAGEQMWNVLTDTVSANITLYAIWEDAHTWGEWADTTPATCTENGERTRECEVCGKTESEAIDALGHDTSSVEWISDSEKHWKICGRCNNKTEISAHDFGTTGICVCGVIEDTPLSEFTFTSLSNNRWEVTKYIGTRSTVVIPSEYEGGAVTSIGSAAFEEYTGLTSIIIPDSVTSIGWYAFSGCTGLTSITIPDSVTSIGNAAFKGCTGLTSITIPDSVTSIGEEAFYGCTGLTSVTIGNGVTSIGEWAFGGYTGLTEIYYTGNVAGWCGISGLSNIMSSGRTLYIGGEKVEGDLVIPDGVTSIGDFAFSGCSGLTSVTIPDSVTSIGIGAFAGCSGLMSIVVEEGNPIYHSDGNCLIETASKTLVVGCKTSVIPDDGSVTSIGDGAFVSCSGLTSVTIPDSVTSIWEYAFEYCTGLTSVTIGNGVTSIGDGAFDGCTGLTSITIPDSVTSIGWYAFSGCTGLTSITIPDSVTSIGDWAFDGCTGLTEIYYTGNVAGWCGISGLSSIMSSGRTLYIGGEKVEGDLVIPDGVTSIGGSAFEGCAGLTSITIPGSVTSIGWHAFYGCTAEIVWGEDPEITKIGDSAFCGYEGASITIPDSVTSIGESAFSGCSGLTSVIIPDSVTRIESYAFEGCSGLTSVTIGNSVTSIGRYAFFGCTGLTSVTIGNSVTSIGWYAFEGCSGLTSVTFEGTVDEWNGISKIFQWNYNCPFTEVVCSDGTVQV